MTNNARLDMCLARSIIDSYDKGWDPTSTAGFFRDDMRHENYRPNRKVNTARVLQRVELLAVRYTPEPRWVRSKMKFATKVLHGLKEFT